MSTATWMGQLPDKKLLRQIVMPGSHDAGVYGSVQTIIRGKALVNPTYTVCQHSDFFKQASAGSRFFDCRVFLRAKPLGQRTSPTDKYENRLGLDHIDGLSTCGTFSSSMKMTKVHEGAIGAVDKHLEHPGDPGVGHLHFVYWQQTASAFGEKDVYKTTSAARKPGKDWSGGAHANLGAFVDELTAKRATAGRLPANVISHDFVTADTCTKIIKMNPEL